MVDVTVVIPVGPGHAQVADRAAASAHAQTQPCNVVVIHDAEGRGPAWARNAGLVQVTTPYVVFLDADDVLAPTFIAHCWVALRPRHYVYTDWWEGVRYVDAPARPWSDGAWHLVTALLPTDAVRAVGGFDEDLPGGEDTDFYMKLTRHQRMCGVHVAVPLVAYTNGGQRAHAFVHSDDHARVQALLRDRYGGLPIPCGANVPRTLSGHPDGVPAVALWRGNRRERGIATGYLYPRAGNGARLRVHPDDAAAAPHLFQPVATPSRPATPPAWVPADTPRHTSFAEVTQRVAEGLGYAHHPATPSPRQVAATVQPDVGRVLALYREAVHDA